MLINSSGNVDVRLKPLLTVEDIDEAAKKTPSYRAPGQQVLLSPFESPVMNA